MENQQRLRGQYAEEYDGQEGEDMDVEYADDGR